MATAEWLAGDELAAASGGVPLTDDVSSAPPLPQPPSVRTPSADVVRVMTWNMDSIVYAPRFSIVGKAARAVELACAHRLSLLVLQEVGDVTLLEKLRSAFHHVLPSWEVVSSATGPAWTGGDGGGPPVVEHHVFAYDTARVTLLAAPFTLVDSAFKRPPVVAEFRLGSSLRATLVSAHLRATSGGQMPQLAEIRALASSVLKV